MAKKFEYLTIKKDCDKAHKGSIMPFTTEEDEFLKLQGLNGWELVSILQFEPIPLVQKTVYYFKKEINE